MWNQYNKVRGLTNNPQEGFNSKLNKMVQTKQPNPNVLVTHLAGCLNDSEMRVWKLKVLFIIVYLNLILYFKAGCSEKSRTTNLTKRLESRREALQRDYGKGDIDEMMFLKTIGSLTDRKKVGNLQAVTGEPPATGLEGGLPAISGENGSLRFKIISEILPL